MRISTVVALGATAPLLLAGAHAAHANAFYLSEDDAKQTGRGDTGVATDIDPSAIVFNPAGIAVGDGTQISIGGALVFADASFTPTGGTKESTTNSPAGVLPSAYLTHKFSKLVSAGLGFYTPFGLAIQWADNSTTANAAQYVSIVSYYVSGVLALNLDDFVPGLSVAAGFDFVPGTVELRQAEYFGADHTCTESAATSVNCGGAHLDGTAYGYGGRFGVMWKPKFMSRLSLGATYDTPVQQNYSGDGAFIAPAPYRSELPPDGAVKTAITLPQRFVVGAAYRPTDALEIEANVSWVNWATFQSLELTLPNATTQYIPEQYTNTTSIRVGAEYALGTTAAVRVGYIYDPTPVPGNNLTPQLPDVNRNDITAGASIRVANYNVHVGLLYVLPTTRDTPPATGTTQYQPEYHGSYDVSAFVADVQLTGKFGQ